MTTELNPEDEITSITFDHPNAHMAICHKAQGYGANGRPEALLIKSEEEVLPDTAKDDLEFIKAASEVRIDTSMFTFLRKWMGMYWDEADALARILGYEGDGNDVTDYIESKMEGITLLKSAISGKAQKYVDEDVVKLKEFIKSFEDLEANSSSEGDSDMNETIEKGGQLKPSEDKPETQGVLMAKTHEETIEKAVADVADLTEKLEALEKAANTAKEEKEALATKVEAFEKAAQERLEKAFEAKVQTYSFVTEEERSEFSKTLIDVDNEMVVEMLDKAQKAINALGEAQGVDAEEEPQEFEKSSGVKDKIMAQFDLQAEA